MQLNPEQQKMIDQQKEQCIFCQIIAGKIPSKKVYEDKLVIGILDINPASKGHILFMPKEHYPIMPLIPKDAFGHLFNKMREVDRCVKEALLCKETTMFIANGAAAGQQSNHFMLHIIPREGNDGLDMLNIGGKKANDEDVKKTIDKLKPQLNSTLARHFGSSGQAYLETMTKEQIVKIIETNPQMKHMIISNTEQFKEMARQHPQLSRVFKNIDIDEVMNEIKKKVPKKPASVDEIIKK